MTEEYTQGWKDGYEYAFGKCSLVKVCVNENGEYSGEVVYNCSVKFDPKVYEKGPSYGNGFAEGMNSGRSAHVTELTKAYCEKNKIIYVDYSLKTKQ